MGAFKFSWISLEYFNNPGKIDTKFSDLWGAVYYTRIDGKTSESEFGACCFD